MKIKKTCLTCEFNYGGFCASHNGELSYKERIFDLEKSRPCWQISLDYSMELASKLPKELNEKYLFDTKFGVKDMLSYYEKI